VRSSDFQEAACACRPFLDEFTGRMEATAVDCTGTCAISTTSAADAKSIGKLTSISFKVGEPRPDIDMQPTLSSSSSVSGDADPAGDTQSTMSSEVLPLEMASPKKAPSKNFGPKVAELPYLKGRPIGVTGYRFIHLHSFQTGIGRVYRGYSLRFPRLFGKMKSYKAKDTVKLLRIRNNELEAWASAHSCSTEQDITKWIVEVDRK